MSHQQIDSQAARKRLGGILSASRRGTLNYTYQEISDLVGCDSRHVQKAETGELDCHETVAKIVEIHGFRPSRRQRVNDLYTQAFGKPLEISI